MYEHVTQPLPLNLPSVNKTQDMVNRTRQIQLQSHRRGAAPDAQYQVTKLVRLLT